MTWLIGNVATFFETGENYADVLLQVMQDADVIKKVYESDK